MLAYETDEKSVDKADKNKVKNKISINNIADEELYNELEFSEELSDGGERNEMVEQQLKED